MSWLSSLFKSGQDQPSPSDFVSKESIPLLRTLFTTFLNQAKTNLPLARPPIVWMPGIVSKSLDPVLDIGHHPILIAGADASDHQKLINFIKVGDIAVYRFPADDTKLTAVFIEHRIHKIGWDKLGRYFKFKGDNNSFEDSYIVRDENIKFVCIGIIY